MPATQRKQSRASGAFVETYDSLLKSCRFGTHHAIVEHRFSLVPDPSQYPSEGFVVDDTHEFDCDLLIIEQICTLEYDPK